MPRDAQKLLLCLNVKYALHLKFLDGLLTPSLYEQVKLLNSGIVFGTIVADLGLVLLTMLDFILSVIFLRSLVNIRQTLQINVVIGCLENPNEIWRFIGKMKAKCESNDYTSPSKHEWVKYYTSEFSPPDTSLQDAFSSALDIALGDCESGPGFTINLGKISQCIMKLKKKYSCGIDQLCGMHLVHGNLNLLHHLGILFQIIFHSGLVPDVFCAGIVTPVPKKKKR